MKPRDLINQRKNFYLKIVAASFLAMVMVAYSDKYLPPLLYNKISIALVAVFIVGVLLVYFGIRCPKCGHVLGLKYVYAEETLKACPKCGVLFDEDSS